MIMIKTRIRTRIRTRTRTRRVSDSSLSVGHPEPLHDAHGENEDPPLQVHELLHVELCSCVALDPEVQEQRNEQKLCIHATVGVLYMPSAMELARKCYLVGVFRGMLPPVIVIAHESKHIPPLNDVLGRAVLPIVILWSG